MNLLNLINQSNRPIEKSKQKAGKKHALTTFGFPNFKPIIYYNSVILVTPEHKNTVFPPCNLHWQRKHCVTVKTQDMISIITKIIN